MYNKMKKEQPKLTVAQTFFKDHKVLVERPEGMEFKEYWVLRYMQNRLIKKMFTRCPARRLTGIIPGAAMYRAKRYK